ncbi:MAG: hybrid sensor histidine kinase/response regulator [Candidatus Hydrogenedentota bacterium]
MTAPAEAETILVVDDVPANQQVAAAILGPEGYNLVFADSGPEALAKLGHGGIDLALLDVMMPGMNGFEVCSAMKSQPESAGIPVIFVTVRDEVDNVVRGLDHGAVDYVSKPIRPPELLARVRTHLALRRGEKQLEIQNSRLRELLAIKDRLFSIIAHDLGSPLASVDAVAHYIRTNTEKLSEAEIREELDEMRKAIADGKSLLGDLNLWARSQIGLFAGEMPAADLEPALRSAIEHVQPAMRAKKIELNEEITSGMEATVHIQMITAILRNLLSNAVKFSHEGGSIRLEAKPVDGSILIRVRDEGVGMDERTLGSLFSIAGQRTMPGTKGEKGSGLGLLLSKEFAAYTGCRLEIRSQPGRGTIAELNIPLILPILPNIK